MSVAVVVPAAGAGARMGGIAKPFLPLAGEPLLLHALRPFLAHPGVTRVVVALRSDDLLEPPGWLVGLDHRIHLVAGGRERGDSVRAALNHVDDAIGIVLIHDAARPLVTTAVIGRAIAAALAGHCAVVGVPVTDTIQEVDERGFVIATPDRRRLRAAQTPQAFPRDVIVDAYRRAAADGVHATDDASLVAHYGGAVLAIEGDRENLKVTTPADVAIAQLLLSRRVR
jgi:2-C-methyl-D-erythritol 4-phosphate cytidylyltransferase